MKVPTKIVSTVDAKVVKVFVKARDEGHYELLGEDSKLIATRSDYVPSFFPGHDGDYIDFDIEIDTGKILNWPKIDPTDVAQAFNLIAKD
jgi:hypothetical protein